jgi:hypothetical protein
MRTAPPFILKLQQRTANQSTRSCNRYLSVTTWRVQWFPSIKTNILIRIVAEHELTLNGPTPDALYSHTIGSTSQMLAGGSLSENVDGEHFLYYATFDLHGEYNVSIKSEIHSYHACCTYRADGSASLRHENI